MKITIKYDKHGNVTKIIGDVGRTRMNRAAYKLWHGEIEPTFRHKVRRFFRRLASYINAKAERAAEIAFAADIPAADVPVIGLLEDYNGRHYDYKAQS